jgi:uncharacterized protein YkwD
MDGRAGSDAEPPLGEPAVRGTSCAGSLAAVAGCGADLYEWLGIPSEVAEDWSREVTGQAVEGEAAYAEPPSPREEPRLEECLALGPPTEQARAELVEGLNDHRQANGLATLEYSLHLEAAADRHAERMFRDRFFGHVWPDGTGPPDRALAAGFCHDRVGENLAYGLNSNDTPAYVMARLAKSPSHNDNMLLVAYRYAGVGLYHHESERGDEYWWVQLMATD